MPDSQKKWVEALFNMETGLMAVSIQQVGFAVYMVKASDGNTYMFKG